MQKLYSVEIIDFIIKYLNEGRVLDSEMSIYGTNLSKIEIIRTLLIDNRDSMPIDIIEEDISNIVNFATGQKIKTPNLNNTNVVYQDFLTRNTDDFNQRINEKETVRLGVIYFLMLSSNIDLVLSSNRDIIPFTVNAMRNRSYSKFDSLMKTLLYPELVDRLNNYMMQNDGDKNDRAKIVYLTLSQTINKEDIKFNNQNELQLFMEQFIITDVNKRIGEPISKSL